MYSNLVDINWGGGINDLAIIEISTSRCQESGSWSGPGLAHKGGLIMPPYLRLGRLPPSATPPIACSPGAKGEGIYYEEVVTAGGLRTRTASSTISGPQRAAPGRTGRRRCRSNSPQSAPCGIII